MLVTIREVPNRFEPSANTLEQREIDPGTRLEALCPEWFDRDSDAHSCVVNGAVPEGAEWRKTLRAGSFVTFMAEPGIAVAFSPATVAAINGILLSTAVSFAVSVVVRQLTGAGKKETQRDDRESATYSFLGIESAYAAEGQALPVIYGRHRTGGSAIQVATRVQSQPPVTTLQLLFSYGEGPVYAIGDKTEDGGPYSNDDPANPLPAGLLIDGQPAENFHGVRAWVRLGSNEQDAIPGFEASSVQFNVGNTMLPRPGAFSIFKVPGSYAQTDVDILDWDNQGTLVAYTMGQEADELTIIFSFANGLFRTSTTTGDLEVALVEVQVRIIEVDDGGTPISGARYAIFPLRQFKAQLNSQFQWEVPIRLIEPDTYAAPIPGQYAIFGGSGHLQDTTPNTLQVPVQPDFQTEASMVCWARFDIEQLPLAGGIALGLPPNFDDVQVLQSYLTGTSGFRIGVFDTEAATYYAALSGLTIYARKMGIEVVAGDGSTSNTYRTTNGDAISRAVLGSYSLEDTSSGWIQVAFTYKANTGPNGEGRLRIFYNGVLSDEFELQSGFRPIWEDTADIVIGARTTGGADRFQGDLDEVLFFGRELAQSELVNFYNGGQGVEATLQTPGIWAGYHFSTGEFLTDFVGTSDLSTAGTAPTQGFAGGAVLSGGTQTPKRGKFKVEAIRLTPTPDDDTFGQDTFSWDVARLSTDQTFTFPNTPLLALEIKASDQLQGSKPPVSVPISGRLVPIWDGADPIYPTFVRAYSANPAWHAIDLILDRTYGLGQYYGARDVDVVAFKALADNCDQYLARGLGDVAASTCSLLYETSGDLQTLRVTGPKASFPDPLTYVVGDAFQLVGLEGAANIEDYESGAAEAYILEQINDGSTTWQLFFTWPEGKAAPADVSFPGSDIDAGTLQPVSRRFTFNGIFDSTNQDAWDALRTILRVARAAPIRVGGRISVFQDVARDPVALVTMANVVEGSFSESWSGFKDRPNIEAIEFLYSAQNWERSYIEREAEGDASPTLTNNYRHRRVFVPGIDNREQAIRYARQDLNLFELSRYALSWEQSIDAVAYTVGDVIKVAHDVLTDTTSGRARQDSTGLRELYMDRPVIIQNGGSYEVEIVDGASGTRQVNAVKMASIPGPFPYTVDVGDALPLFEDMQWTPAQGDIYTFGVTDLSSRLVSIVDIQTADNDLHRRIRALEYDPAIYPTETEALPVAASTGPSEGPMPQGAQVPDPVAAPGVEERSSVGRGGEIELAADVTWRSPAGTVSGLLYGPSQFAGPNRDGRLAVWLAERDRESWVQVGEAPLSSSSMRLSGVGFQRGTRYRIALQSVSAAGVRMSIDRAPKVDFSPSGVVRAPAAPTAISSRISGRMNVWNLDGDLDRFNALEIRRGGWILGQTVAVSAPGSYEFDPTSDWVEAGANDNGEARPTVYGRGRLGNGQVSEAVIGKEVGPPVSTTPRIVWQTIEEDDDFDGTLSGLQLEAAPATAPYLPAIDRGPKLKFDGSELEGTYTFGPPALAEAQSVWLQVLVDAIQEADFTTDQMPAAGSRDADAISTEGALTGESCRVYIEERHTNASTFSGSEPWTTYRAGRYFFRLVELRVRATRPSTDFDIRIRRIAGRALKLNPRRIDHLAIQSFGR